MWIEELVFLGFEEWWWRLVGVGGVEMEEQPKMMTKSFILGYGSEVLVVLGSECRSSMDIFFFFL